jgi:hypothetical protein
LSIDTNTGVINYYYGSNVYTISGSPSASIGIAGIHAGDYYSYDAASAILYADSTIEHSNLIALPGNVTYSFTPYQIINNVKGNLTANESGNIYPNPVSDVLNVQIDSKASTLLSINIMDVSGKIISKKNVEVSPGSNLKKLNVQDLPAGNYFISIYENNGQIKKLSFVKY